jgi:hypothetical protein
MQAADLNSGKQRSRKGKGPCVYCGVAPATTRDHIVPKCLFPEPLPELITAPACLKCNREKALDEQYLRDVLAVDIYTSEQPGARSIFDGKMARARVRNRSEIARSGRHARMEPLYTPGGIYLGNYATIPLDWERISRIIGMIIRGLYWQIRREVFPQGYMIDVARIDPLEVRTVAEAMSATHVNGPYRLGDSTFSCVMQFVKEDPGMSRWLLCFYQNFVLLVTTKPEAPNPSLEPPW